MLCIKWCMVKRDKIKRPVFQTGLFIYIQLKIISGKANAIPQIIAEGGKSVGVVVVVGVVGTGGTGATKVVGKTGTVGTGGTKVVGKTGAVGTGGTKAVGKTGTGGKLYFGKAFR
jgi:hypothetical protein